MMNRFSRQTLALIVSLALNGFLLAYVAVSLAGGHRGFPPGPEALLTHMANRLPDADGAILRAAIDRHKSALKDAEGAFKTELGEITRLLAEPTVDAEALKRSLEEIRRDRISASVPMIAILSEAMPEISHKSRLRVARRLSGP